MAVAVALVLDAQFVLVPPVARWIDRQAPLGGDPVAAASPAGLLADAVDEKARTGRSESQRR